MAPTPLRVPSRPHPGGDALLPAGNFSLGGREKAGEPLLLNGEQIKSKTQLTGEAPARSAPKQLSGAGPGERRGSPRPAVGAPVPGSHPGHRPPGTGPGSGPPPVAERWLRGRQGRKNISQLFSRCAQPLGARRLRFLPAPLSSHPPVLPSVCPSVRPASLVLGTPLTPRRAPPRHRGHLLKAFAVGCAGLTG